MTIEKLLRLNLQYFAADEGGGNGGGESSDGNTNTDTQADDNSAHNEHMIPKSRFDEVNESFKTMKKELDEMKTAQEQADLDKQAKEKEDAKKRGEYENLYNDTNSELETAKATVQSANERIESLEGVINGLLETKLETINEDFHDLIPEGMTPEQKLAWVNNAESKGLFGKQEAHSPLGEQTNPKGNGETDVTTLNPLQMMASGYGK